MTKSELLDLIESWENLSLFINGINKEPEILPALMDIALNSNAPKSWRAAWLADKIHEEHPQLIKPWINEIVIALKTEKQAGKKRHFLKLISLQEPDEKHDPFLLDYCLGAFTNGKEPISIRVHAMQVLYNISEKQPGFKPELLAIIEHEIELHPTAGIRSRGRKLAKKLARQIV